MAETTEPMTVRLPTSIAKIIRESAAESGANISDYLRGIIAKGLESSDDDGHHSLSALDDQFTQIITLLERLHDRFTQVTEGQRLSNQEHTAASDFKDFQKTIDSFQVEIANHIVGVTRRGDENLTVVNQNLQALASSINQLHADFVAAANSQRQHLSEQERLFQARSLDIAQTMKKLRGDVATAVLGVLSYITPALPERNQQTQEQLIDWVKERFSL